MNFESSVCFLRPCTDCPLKELASKLRASQAVDQVLASSNVQRLRRDRPLLLDLASTAAQDNGAGKWQYVIARAVSMTLKGQCESRN